MQLTNIAALLLPVGFAAAVPSLAGRSPFVENPPVLSPGPNGEPIVVPGAGFPSIESLGLTSANLYDESFMESYFANRSTKRSPTSDDGVFGDAHIEKRFPDSCLTLTMRASVPGAVACGNYLAALGTTPCTAPPSGVIMCYTTAGFSGVTTYISGHSLSGGDSTSWCVHAAEGVWFGRNHCAFCPESSDCIFISLAAAWGNGNLIIGTWGTAYWT
jgi:hypothetical protein